MRNRTRRSRPRAVRWMLGAAVVSVLPLFSPPASAGGRCVTVEVPGAFVLPDGDVHPAGSLKLCDSLRLSPVTGLHKAYVGGHLTAVFPSRVGRSEGPARPEPYVQFRRNAQQLLEVIGYAWPDGSKMKTFSLVRHPVRGSGSGEEESPEHEPVILVAAAN